MKITKNWFYKLSEFKSDQLFIDKNLVVSIFDDLNNDINVELWENSRVEYFWFVEKSDDLKINFIQKEVNSKLSVKYFLFSKWENKIKAKIYSWISASYSISDVKILSIIWEKWFVDLDWIIDIMSWVEKVHWDLQEENLFLWDSAKAKWIPTLLVKSNDVKASHACKMERISDEKLFYLRSRWIWKENALSIMIEAKIKSIFSCISMLDKDFYEELVEKILLKIK